MNKQKFKLQLITIFLRLFMLIFCLQFCLVACNNADIKSKKTNSFTTETNLSLTDSIIIDTGKLQIEKPDTLIVNTFKVISKPEKINKIQTRMSEGVSDAKFNGEPILLQEELSEKILLKNPDTIRNYLKAVYLNQERNFPRSIADNFEKGISTEHISYPKLNYRIELFENKYSVKPYKVLGYIVRKEKEKVIVE